MPTISGPEKSWRPCKVVGCPGTVRRGKYCRQHLDPVARPGIHEPRRKAQRRTRPGVSARGYGWKWQKLRRQVLRRYPHCRLCLAQGKRVMAHDVDHIVEKQDGGTDSVRNLQPLCSACHTRKTVAMREYRRKMAELGSG